MLIWRRKPACVQPRPLQAAHDETLLFCLPVRNPSTIRDRAPEFQLGRPSSKHKYKLQDIAVFVVARASLARIKEALQREPGGRLRGKVCWLAP